ncbi:MAG: MlaD family protein [Verrucomicrobia bacterium]|nr:MlaD family protein [Verrucomicrobiota bacterium]
MKEVGIAWKVGLFVAISLIAIGGVVMSFSKGVGMSSRYPLLLSSQNAAGLIPGAKVLMSGVPIGSVRRIEIDPDVKNVTITTEILTKFNIRSNSVFTITQSGFLGDQYISVFPSDIHNPPLLPGSIVPCEEPFDISEVVRASGSLLKRVDAAIAQMSTAIERVDRTLLTETTLTNLATTIVNFRTFSDRMLLTWDNLDQVISSNAPTLAQVFTNLNGFSIELKDAADELREILVTNKDHVASTLRNFEASSEKINTLLTEVTSGKGLAGALLNNSTLAANVSVTVSNFSVLSSNINSHGIWSVIRKPRVTKAAEPENK